MACFFVTFREAILIPLEKFEMSTDTFWCSINLTQAHYWWSLIAERLIKKMRIVGRYLFFLLDDILVMRMARPQEPSFCCRVFLSKSFQRERKLFNPFLAPLSICCSIWMEFPRGASAGHRHQSEFELSITSIVSQLQTLLPRIWESAPDSNFASVGGCIK